MKLDYFEILVWLATLAVVALVTAAAIGLFAGRPLQQTSNAAAVSSPTMSDALPPGGSSYGATRLLHC